MTTSDPVEPLGDPVAPPPSVDPFLEAKLNPPPNRDNWVQRERLIEAMDGAARHPVTLVAAPAGYGKTTLVAQWLSGRTGQPRRGSPSTPATTTPTGCGPTSPRPWSGPAAPSPPVSRPRRRRRTPKRPRRALLPAIVSALAADAGRHRPRPRRLPLHPAAGLPRAGRVPDREPARPSAPGHHHPLGPRSATGPAARLQRPGRDPRRRPQLHHARGDRAARARPRPASRPQTVIAADGAHRGLAGGALPGHAVAGRPSRRRRLRAARSAAATASSATT